MIELSMASAVRISGIVEESIVDGSGIRFVIFTQGCPHHCAGCHNPVTHDFAGGKIADTNVLFAAIKENPLLKGVTFSGGEPFCQPEPLTLLARQVHALKRDVTTYTGYTLEELQAMHNPAIDALLAETDFLIDGRFVLANRDLTLKFRGSSNQRIIDMNKTRTQGTIVTIY